MKKIQDDQESEIRGNDSLTNANKKNGLNSQTRKNTNENEKEDD